MYKLIWCYIYFTLTHKITSQPDWKEFTNQGNITYGHYLLPSHKINICNSTTKTNYKIVYIDHLTHLKNNLTKISNSYTSWFMSEVNIYNNESTIFQQIHNYRLTLITKKTTFHLATKTCIRANATLLELNNDDIFFAAKELLDKTNIPTNEQIIWQPIINKNPPLFPISRSYIPTILNKTQITTSLPNPSIQTICPIFNIINYTFSSTICANENYGICFSKRQPSKMFKHLTTYHTINSSFKELFHTINKIKNLTSLILEEEMDHSNPATLQLFDKPTLTIIDNLSNIDKKTFNTDIQTIIPFLQFLILHLKHFESTITGKSNDLTYLTQECCDTSIQRSPPTIITQILKQDNLITLQASTMENCSYTTTTRVIPINHNSKHQILGTYLIQNSNCHSVPQNLNQPLSLNNLPKDICCSNMLQDKPMSCNMLTNFPDFYVRNSSMLLVSSNNTITLNYSCSPQISTQTSFIIKINHSSPCTVKSTIPFINELSGDILTFKDNNIIQLSSPSKETDNNSYLPSFEDLIPYIAFIGSLTTILTFALTIFLFLSRQRSQQTPHTENHHNIELQDIQTSQQNLSTSKHTSPHLKSCLVKTPRKRHTPSSSSFSSDNSD